MRRWLAITDVLSIGAALLGAYVLRYGVLPEGSPALTAFVVVPPVTVIAFALLGLYSDGVTRLAPELLSSVLATTLVVIALIVVSFWTEVYLSRTWLTLTWIMAVAFIATSRVAWRVSSQ